MHKCYMPKNTVKTLHKKPSHSHENWFKSKIKSENEQLELHLEVNFFLNLKLSYVQDQCHVINISNCPSYGTSPFLNLWQIWCKIFIIYIQIQHHYIQSGSHDIFFCHSIIVLKLRKLQTIRSHVCKLFNFIIQNFC